MKIDVSHIAKLANLKLTPQEEKKFGKQLSAILEHIEKLSGVETENTEETSQVTGLINISTEDKIRPSLNQQDALKNAGKTYNGQFVVPIIINEAIEE